MRNLVLRRFVNVAIVLTAFAGMAVGQSEADFKAAMVTTVPKDIKWVEGANGAATAVLAGDPGKPGLYVVLNKWHPGHMSRPHFHQNDRYIYVISGTWWVGAGKKYDPNSTKPMGPGSYVLHMGKGIHYDGAKDGEAIIEIVGMGPATATPAEEK